MEKVLNRKQPNKKVCQLAISRILPGMITARDVYSRNDQLILNRETTLDSNRIAKIMFYAIESVYVYEPENSGTKSGHSMEQMRNSIEFRNFKKDYDSSVLSVQTAMNDVIERNEELDPDQLLSEVTQIISRSKSRTDVFHMLQCMKGYDDQTYVHSVNVALLCNIFADWLGMPRADKEAVTLCGLLHDIGKLTIPKNIINKPEKLTPQEYEIMKQHTVRGYELVKDMDLDKEIKQAILLHHERYNGAGYPFHRTGNEVNSFAMLTAIADVYNAMTSDRIYRAAFCPFDVIREFEENGKQLYDPKYLIPLLERIAETYISQTVRLNSDEEGEIVMLNRDTLSRPLVRVENKFIDLSRDRERIIHAIL